MLFIKIILKKRSTYILLVLFLLITYNKIVKFAQKALIQSILHRILNK